MRDSSGIIEMNNNITVGQFCSWNVTVRPGKKISVKILKLKMSKPATAICSNSYILVSLNLIWIKLKYEIINIIFKFITQLFKI